MSKKDLSFLEVWQMVVIIFHNHCCRLCASSLDNSLGFFWDPGTNIQEDLDGASPFHHNSAPPRSPLLHRLHLQTEFPFKASTLSLGLPLPFISGAGSEALSSGHNQCAKCRQRQMVCYSFPTYLIHPNGELIRYFKS